MPPNQLNFTIFITELLPYSLVEHTNIQMITSEYCIFIHDFNLSYDLILCGIFNSEFITQSSQS